MPEEKESLDVSANSIEEAIEQGLTQLDLSREQVEIEVVSEGKRGLFGLGSEEALVRLTPKSSAQAEAPPLVKEEAAPPVAVESGEEAGVEEEVSPEVETTEAEAAAEPAVVEEETALPEHQKRSVEEIGTEHLTNLLRLMGIEAEVEARIGEDLAEPGDEPPLVLDIQGKDLGILIGRRNETLRALQFMVRLMVNKEMGSWQSLVVDVESYRARRRESLRRMAQRMAERASANKERVVLEAMPAYERRIVHIALRDHPAVITKSVGRDKHRKVTIIPKK